MQRVPSAMYIDGLLYLVTVVTCNRTSPLSGGVSCDQLPTSFHLRAASVGSLLQLSANLARLQLKNEWVGQYEGTAFLNCQGFQ